MFLLPLFHILAMTLYSIFYNEVWFSRGSYSAGAIFKQYDRPREKATEISWKKIKLQQVFLHKTSNRPAKQTQLKPSHPVRPPSSSSASAVLRSSLDQSKTRLPARCIPRNHFRTDTRPATLPTQVSSP